MAHKFMKPYSTSGKNRYCRLFPPSAVRTQEELFGLYEVGSNMIDDGSDLSRAPEKLAFTGYTYFGQFVDHDLTRDTSSIDDAFVLEPEEIQNQETPRLDLGHLYGNGPFDSQDAKYYVDNDVRFKIGPRNGRGGGAFDIGTDDSGVPLTVDDRTVENAIVRQVAAVFMQLHNCAVEQFRKDFPGNLPGLFARAQLQTTWQFQRLLWGDYLPRLLDLSAFKTVFTARRPMLEWNVFSIPVEVSAAAMRFGHSMVREKYLLSKGNDRTLRELFADDLRHRSLPPEYEIDWGFFFQGASPGGAALSSRPIDTRISAALHHIPSPTKRLFNAPSVATKPLLPDDALDKLPVRTLLRGAALQLPSGQTVAGLLGESILREDELTTNRDGKLTAAGKKLRDYRMGLDTPLWYYVLKESEVRYNGNRIGPVGSRILAETFYAALLFDPDSILNHPAANVRRLPEWKIGSKTYVFDKLRALFAAAPALGKV